MGSISVILFYTKLGSSVLNSSGLICMPETPFPDNRDIVFIYSAFVKGDQTYFDIEASSGVEGTQLYPHQKYTTINEYFDTLLKQQE